MRKLVLGIHSIPSESNLKRDYGHSYITLGYSDEPLSRHETFGLWDEEPAKKWLKILKDDYKTGDDAVIDYTDTHVRKNLEKELSKSSNKASRYYEITPDQFQKFRAYIAKKDTWGYSHTCAEWAAEAIQAVTGQFIDPDSLLFGVETPSKLKESIEKLEGQQPSSLEKPIPPAQHNLLKTENNSIVPNNLSNFAINNPGTPTNESNYEMSTRLLNGINEIHQQEAAKKSIIL